MKLAMRIGGEYRIRSISRRHWERLAAASNLPADAVLAIVRDVVGRTPDALADVCHEATSAGLSYPVLQRLQKTVATHARFCVAQLSKSA